MNPWRRIRVELAGAWRSVGYDLRRWITGQRPGTPGRGGGAHRAGGPVTRRRLVVVSAFGLAIVVGAGGGYLALGTGATPSAPPTGAPPNPLTADGPTGGGAQAGGPEPDGVRAAESARLGRRSGSPAPQPSPTPLAGTGAGAGAAPATAPGRSGPPRRDRPVAPPQTTGGVPPAPIPVPPSAHSPRPSSPAGTPTSPSWPVTSYYTTWPPSVQPSGSVAGQPPSGKPTRPRRPRR
ncbi:hypothetical protein [Krasilnikovia sp. M28-CT-15]|uniref:hypothetical protein n=1 Tax=Krasilnikovia sp. M28-CT-15 TaxID=3373540 RepID=UPI003875ED13